MYLHRGPDRTEAMRLTDPIGMQRDAHHPALFGAFLIHRVEVIADLAGEFRCLLAAPMQDHVVQSTEYGIDSSLPVFTFSGNGWSS